MVIRASFLNSMAWRAAMIRRIFDPLHQSVRNLSSVALERSSKGPLEILVAASGGKVLANHRSQRKHTRERIENGEKF